MNMAPTLLSNQNNLNLLTLEINGLLSSIEFQKAKCCAEVIYFMN